MDAPKKRVENLQIGGKGTIRRKRKGNPKITSTRITDEEMKYNKLINQINGLIKDIDNETIDHWSVFLNDWLDDITEELKKKDFKNLPKTEEERFSLTSTLVDGNLLLKDYKFYKKTFTNQGYEYIIDTIDMLVSSINKKEYIQQQSEWEEIEDLNKYYKLLDLDKTKVPSKKDLHDAYKKKSAEYHPDKHPEEVEKYTKLFTEINKANKILLKYYFDK